MGIALDRLALKLESELGADLVSRDAGVLSAHANSKTPELVCSPRTQEQVVTILRISAEAKAAVTPWGGGTGINVGNIPRETSIVIALTGLNRIIEHDHANLTVTVQSGITLTALHESLSLRRQFLPFDAPYPGRATIGGTIALNINGPRRGHYGATRDLITGMKVALVTGEEIKAGGKVVKNVAGYDMCKLFTGSLGTLGVITEVTLRVAPVPDAAATIIASGSFKEVVQFVDRLAQSMLLPVAVVLTSSQPYSAGKNWQVALWCEGFAENVNRHLADTEVLARQIGIGTTVLRGTDHGALWDDIRDFPLEAERCMYRVILPRLAVTKFINSLSRMDHSVPALVSDMMTGTIWLSWPANSQAATVWPQLGSLAAEHGGHAVMFAAPERLKERQDVWGAVPATLPLMQKIKQQFDPHGLLNPGRFIGGI
jgi:glycolate oxidase FAD binding subunit